MNDINFAQKYRPAMDGMSRVVRPMPMFRPRPNPQPVMPPRRTYAKPAAPTRHRKRLPQWLQVVLAVPVIMAASLFMQSAVFGQLAIVAYGIIALIWRIPSRTTFTLALLSMVATTILLVVRGDIAMAQNFATYTFLFLVVGVFTLSRELKKEGGRIYSIRQHKHN